MTNTDIEFSKSIIGGLNYLMMEAENSQNMQIARLLKICLKDVCLVIEGKSNKDGSTEQVLCSDLMTAISFLTKYASIKDEALKQDILKEIETVHNTFTSWRH